MSGWGRKECGHYDIASYDGDCHECHQAKTGRGELYAAKIVRCPRCGETWEPGFENMVESQWCGQCGHDFEVGMNVEVTWDSPPILTEHPEDYDGPCVCDDCASYATTDGNESEAGR